MRIIDVMQVEKIPEKYTGILNNFYKDVKKTNPYVEPTYVNVNIADNPVINMQALGKMLMNIDKLSDQELYDLILKTYDNILSDIFLNGDTSYLQIFTNSRFLTILNQVLYKINLSYDNRIYCNKIVYDYLTANNGDSFINDLLLALARTVNRDVIPSLVGLGIPEDLASTLALSRFSSKKELVNIKRLNFVICSSDLNLMTEQMIIFIYEKLIDNFTFLFEGTMFDVCDYNYVTAEYAEIYSLVSLAILDILNNMPSENIKKVLTSYAGDFYSIMNVNHNIRFSMQNLSIDYIRIIQVIEYLKNTEKIYIP